MRLSTSWSAPIAWPECRAFLLWLLALELRKLPAQIGVDRAVLALLPKVHERSLCTYPPPRGALRRPRNRGFHPGTAKFERGCIEVVESLRRSSIRRQLLLSPHEALASLAAEVVRGPCSRTGDERP